MMVTNSAFSCREEFAENNVRVVSTRRGAAKVVFGVVVICVAPSALETGVVKVWVIDEAHVPGMNLQETSGTGQVILVMR